MDFRYQPWGKGDLDATFGLFFDGLSKVLSAVGVMLFVFGMPSSLVLGKMLPAIGIATLLGNVWYFYEALRLAKKEKRQNVTALPYGIGAAQVASWLFLIMGPIYWSTGDAMLAFRVSLAAGFIGGLIEIMGAYFGGFIIKIIPTSALLGNLASSAFIWLTIAGIIVVFDKPEIAVIPVLVIFMGYIAKLPILSGKFPMGLAVILVGTLAAWVTGNMSVSTLMESFADMQIVLPNFFIKEIFQSFSEVVPYLPIIVPLQICNFLTTLQGVEAAKQAGDAYPERQSMFMDGLFTTVGALLGNPFPTTVYYGHDGWKSIDARAGYSLAVGLLYAVLMCTGLTGVIMALVPYQVVMVLLVFIGFKVTANTYQRTPKELMPVLIISLIPIIMQYIQMVIGNGVQAAGGVMAEISAETFASFNLTMRGINLLANGAFLLSLLWATWLEYLITKKYGAASITAFVMAGISLIGMIHSSSITLFDKDASIMAFCYIVAGVICFIQYLQFKKDDKHPFSLGAYDDKN